MSINRSTFAFYLALGLTACGGGTSTGATDPPTGGGASPVPTPQTVGTMPSPNATGLTVAPASVFYNTGTQLTILAVSNARGSLSAKIADPTVADVAVTGSGALATITVSPIAAGVTAISIADGSSTVSVPVTISPCEPPVPEISLVAPPPNSTLVPTSTNSALFMYGGYTVPAAVLSGVVADYRVRLISAAGGVFGGMLTPLASPPTGYSPPPSPGGFASASLPKLTAGTTYRVQVFSTMEPCLFPEILGSFTTTP